MDPSSHVQARQPPPLASCPGRAVAPPRPSPWPLLRSSSSPLPLAAPSPRGFGRTSYRLAEVVQLGRVPVYLYDDVPWVPYEGTNLSLASFGFAGQMGRLRATAKAMKRAAESADEFRALLGNVKRARAHYTYGGVMRQIEAFLRDPFGPGGGELRCARLPDKDKR